MSIQHRIVLLVALLLIRGMPALSQPQEKLDWKRYEAESGVLRAAIEQLGKEGFTAEFDAAQINEFGNVFVAAIVPVRTTMSKPGAEEGTLGIMVILAKTPSGDLEVSEVLRLDYKKNTNTQDTDVEGKQASVTSGAFYFNKDATLYLIVDQGGEVREKINKLLFESVWRSIKSDCLDLKMKAVKQRCQRIEGKSFADRIRCSVSGWLWAKQECWKISQR
jgi:hypothetical protein